MKHKSLGTSRTMASNNKVFLQDTSSCDASDSSSSSHANTSKSKSRRSQPLDKDSEEYKQRRERNNLAVKKSRIKSKMKTQQTLERVRQLRNENEMLENKIKLLTKELGFLKDLFLAHAGAHGQQLSDADLELLKEDHDPLAEMDSSTSARDSTC